mgnify:CR=1 FL=1
MRILILGDVMGISGRNAIEANIKNIIKDKKIDFVVVNGENAADDGKGITKEIADLFFSLGVDVITSGNHIWDKSETPEHISNEQRLLRPENLVEGSPGLGHGIFVSKNNSLVLLFGYFLILIFLHLTYNFQSLQEIYLYL